MISLIHRIQKSGTCSNREWWVLKTVGQLKWEDVGKGYTFSVISSISSGDLLYGMIVYSNSAKRVDLKGSHHHHQKKSVYLNIYNFKTIKLGGKLEFICIFFYSFLFFLSVSLFYYNEHGLSTAREKNSPMFSSSVVQHLTLCNPIN